MAQWEGDGELVGVRTKMLFTASESISTIPEYQSSYFTEVKKKEGRGGAKKVMLHLMLNITYSHFGENLELLSQIN
jgi:hypothetical protein